MYELRIKLPFLSDQNPNIETMKRDLVAGVAKTGQIPSFAISSDPANIQLVKLPESTPAAGIVAE